MQKKTFYAFARAGERTLTIKQTVGSNEGVMLSEANKRTDEDSIATKHDRANHYIMPSSEPTERNKREGTYNEKERK